MRPGDVVTSRRHQGLIRLVVVYTNGGGIGKKLKKDGTPSRREVCFGPGDIDEDTVMTATAPRR